MRNSSDDSRPAWAGDGDRSKAAMTPSDLSTLGIDRGPARARRRRARWISVVAVATVAAAAAAASAKYGGAVTVETATVTSVYPSQALTTVTATGHVVQQA